MGGITCDVNCATPLPGLFAAGECASVGIHGANRLGSNSLAELLVFGKVAGESALRHAREQGASNTSAAVQQLGAAAAQRVLKLLTQDSGDRVATLRDGMRNTMETNVGIYREAKAMQDACDTLAELRDRYRRGVKLDDRSRAFNTEWLSAIELNFTLQVAEAMAHSAVLRLESRGAHQRLDQYNVRDDDNFLCHSLATAQGDGPPRITHGAVTITKSSPRARVYGGAGTKAVMT
jgi:fumarate reductase flavoprotein subunit